MRPMADQSPWTLRSPALRNMRLELGEGVDRSVQHHRRGNAAVAQCSGEGGRLPVTMRDRRAQAFAARGPAVRAGHLRRGPVDLLRSSTIDEIQAVGIEVRLCLEPIPTPPQDDGAVLLGCMRRFFLRVIQCRSKKRVMSDLCSMMLRGDRTGAAKRGYRNPTWVALPLAQGSNRPRTSQGGLLGLG